MAQGAAPTQTAPGLGTGQGGTGTGQSPAGGTPSSGAAQGANGTGPGVTGGQPGTGTANRPLTLSDVVAQAVGNNSGLVLARQRLQRAQESINQVNAQLRPQFRLNANDVYSSYPAFPSALPVPTLTNPTLPDNGQIPTVTDQANNFSTAFIGSSGLALGGANVAPGGVSAATGVSGPGPAGTGTNVSANPGAGTNPTTPGTTATPGNTGAGGNAPGAPASSPGTSSPATPATPNTPAAPSAPASPRSGGGTPGNGNGGAGTGAGGSTGAAFAAYPLIVTDYVADPHTLLEPPSPSVSAAVPAIKILPAETKTESASEDKTAQIKDQPQQDDPTTGTSTSTVTPSRGKRDTYAAGGNVTQYIDLFGLIGSARNSEKDVRDFYALDITRLQNEIALAAKNLYFNVLYTQALVTTDQEQVNYAQEDVRITESRLRNGVVSRFDVLTAQTALATAQQQLTAAQDQSQLAQSELSYLLGTDPDQPLTLQEPPLPPLDQPVDLKQSTQVALRQRPELGQASRNIDNAQRQARLAGAGLLPVLGVVGSAEYTSNASTATPRSYGTISAQVALPLDDGGLTRSRVRSAQVEVQTQVITQEQLQLSISLEVRQATVNIRNAQAEVASAQVSVDRSQEALRLARERYQAGLGTFLDVLNALAELSTARTNLANAQYFYQSSLAQLVRAIGGR